MSRDSVIGLLVTELRRDLRKQPDSKISYEEMVGFIKRLINCYHESKTLKRGGSRERRLQWKRRKKTLFNALKTK